MRMEHLYDLLEIEKYHSISAAAQAHYLSQTTLSSIVKSAEEELGFLIFKRTHCGVQTTAEGEEALAIIREILSRYEEIQKLGGPDTSRSPVPLILSPTISESLCLPLSRLFLEREPDGNLEFRTGVGDEIGSRIINGEGNIGITYYTQRHLEEFQAIAAKYQVEVEVLRRDRLCLLLRRDHPLAARESVSVHDLVNLNFAILDHFNTQEDSIAYAKHLGSGNRYATFPNVTLLKRAVCSENCVSILSDYAIRHGAGIGTEPEQFIGLPLSDTREENDILMYLIRRQDRSVRHQEKVLIRCIRDYFRSIDEEEQRGSSSGSDPQ